MSESCRFHAQGRCRYGTACKFSHDIQGSLSTRAQRSEDTESSGPANRQPNRRGRYQRRDQQTPDKPKAAESQIQRTITQRLASENPGKASVGPSRGSKSGEACHTWKVGTCTRGAKCQVQHQHVHVDAHLERVETEAKLAAQAHATEIAKEAAKVAAAKTVQSVVLGSIVTFGAGLELSHLVTGFECCTLRIGNLPPNVQEPEINALFTERGLDRGRFHVVSVKPMATGRKLSAEIITDAESGQALSLDLGGLEFRDEILTLEVSGYNSPGSMSAAAERDVDVLTISWRVPSVRYIAAYPASVTIAEKVRELNNRVCSGRRVKVEVNTMPPGRFVHNFQENSVKISFLPPAITDEEVEAFSGSDSVKRLQGKVFVEDTSHIATTLRDDVECISHGTLRSMEPLLPIPSIDGIALVRARFASWDDANAVHNRLLNHRIGGVSFWFRLPNPTQYTITISAEQFRAQKSLWDALVEGIKDKRSCMLHIHEQGPVVRMRLSGSKKEAIGGLKVRVESLIAGEKVDGWHRTLGYSGNVFARSVFDNTGALLRADWRRQALKVYGQPKAVDQARELIKAELDRLSSMEYTRVLAKQSIRFFVQRGIPELKETFGEDNVKFVISAGRITISGGEEARHALERLIQDSLRGPQILPDPSGQQSCPICYDDISSPLHLGCGHAYCAACMRHFLTSALDSGQFPLTCMGNESQCRVPIPIPTIQQFLPPASFNRLLEVAFNAHISRNPQEFKYCKTPDCNQIYRSAAADSTTVGQCPSCFSNICTSCHEDVHDGMSCDEYKRTGRLAEEERQTEAWIAAQGGRVKRCPTCQALIEKLEGCNHMTCSLCKSHICWRCMGIFTASTIYEHMRNQHGTIHDDDPVDNHVDVQAVRFHGLGREEMLEEWGLEHDPFEERQRRNELIMAAARHDATVRREAAARQEAAAARRVEIARRAEVARRQEVAARQMADATRQRLQNYQETIRQRRLEEERERARSQEERPGWGCTIM